MCERNPLEGKYFNRKDNDWSPGQIVQVLRDVCMVRYWVCIIERWDECYRLEDLARYTDEDYLFFDKLADMVKDHKVRHVLL